LVAYDPFLAAGGTKGSPLRVLAGRCESPPPYTRGSAATAAPANEPRDDWLNPPHLVVLELREAPDDGCRTVTHLCVAPTDLSQRPAVPLGSGRSRRRPASLADHEIFCCAW
jgi:hypothetical protein